MSFLTDETLRKKEYFLTDDSQEKGVSQLLISRFLICETLL